MAFNCPNCNEVMYPNDDGSCPICNKSIRNKEKEVIKESNQIIVKNT